MTREQAQAERDRLAAEHPEATWLATEGDDGWQVVKVGLPGSPQPGGTQIAGKPRPEQPDSPPSPDKQIYNPNWGF
jgi:hypothetical protein